MFPKSLHGARGENFTYELRSMIIDRVDFPGLDLKFSRPYQAVHASLCFLGWLCP